MTARCIIVEDEPLATERLVEFVGRLPLLHLEGTFENASDAFVHLKTNRVELVFLDIRLGGWSGLEMLETGAIRCQVILTTAYPEHAARAYDLRVVDYLVKPFSFERFIQAVDRALPGDHFTSRMPNREFVFIKTGQRLEKVRLSDIVVIEGQRDYRRIHLAGRRIMTLETFGEFEREFPPEIICRVHKSYMVALDKIESIEQGQIRIQGMTIPISETYRDRLYALIGRKS